MSRLKEEHESDDASRCKAIAAARAALVIAAADRAGGAGGRVRRSSPSRLRRRAGAQAEHRPGGEANLVLPDLGQVDVGGYNGRTLLMIGLGRLARSACCSAWSS